MRRMGEPREPVELPIFHLGTYKSASGVPVTFTHALLRQLVKNTNAAIAMKFQPPVGYDHPVARDTSAHGRIARMRYDERGIAHATIEGASDQLANDAKDFRRLTWSPEFHENFEIVDGGKPVALGPTTIGLAMLGAQRGAIKNTAMIPLSEVNFGEGVDAADKLLLRAELRSLGYLGEYEVDGKFFGEIENDERRFFSDTKKEHSMTDAEIQAAIANGIKAATEPLQTKLAEQDKQIKSFGEEAKTRTKVLAFCETVAKEKPLGKLAMERLEELALSADAPTFEKVRSFVEAIPAVIVPGGRSDDKTTNGGGDVDEDVDEPKALAALKPKHFAEMTDPGNQTKIVAGVKAFAEFKPDAIKGIEQDFAAQTAKVRQYISARDLAAASN